ncbi:MAG: hypothetical protein KC621_27380 [Myxococcales bacterium]|nr:hypothetical protein [Myxococcales bacterium]
MLRSRALDHSYDGEQPQARALLAEALDIAQLVCIDELFMALDHALNPRPPTSAPPPPPDDDIPF